ncbi:MAG: hypothetical protein EXQ47_11430 [Bryobacterales bacterium]|nr:hypothetical protein [Bryobacterales bacterium]
MAIPKILNSYPTSVELSRLMRAHGAEIVFLSFESLESALEIVRMFESDANQAQIFGFHSALNTQILYESMRAGVREFLVDPFHEQALFQSLSHVKSLLDRRPVDYADSDQIFAFLPSKAGVGTSTIAANTGSALARMPDMRVLLADFDLSSGMLRFMLKLNNEFSVFDAAKYAYNMDEALWPQLVTKRGGMDVLHAGPLNPNLRIDAKQIRGLVTFMRRQYGTLCFDLSGNLEKYSLELMQESKRILMVCTPEIPSLHMAREKMAFLKQMDLDSRVSVVLTRMEKKVMFSKQQVEDLVGVSVIRTFPNDYPAVNRSLASGTLLPETSELGKAFEGFANALVAPKALGKLQPYERKFLDFATPPASLALRGRN